MKRVQIMAVGSELLTPYYQDTNSLFLTQRLNDLGLNVSVKTVAPDDHDGLFLQVKIALAQADLIFVTGGLGPTEDDRTREVFAEVLGKKLILQDDLLIRIQERFARRGMNMPISNKKQAFIPEGAEILINDFGTAAGLWLNTGQNIVVLMPGPPHEMKPMFENQVWPRLQQFRTGYRTGRVLKITGLTESMVEDLVQDLYPKEQALQVTTLAYPGQIEIHLTSYSTQSAEQADESLKQLALAFLERLKENVFSAAGEDLETVIGRMLAKRRETVAVAESCTGGLIGHRLTNVPGSSEYFLEGAITYSNESKIDNLGVPADHIRKFGAVSVQVAKSMAAGIRTRARASYGLAVTGIAGPTGGTEGKPVGLVYTALAWDKSVEAVKNQFLGNREQVKFQASQKALDMLRRLLLQPNADSD
jgi:nicotinamide-nucleotide amidase